MKPEGTTSEQAPGGAAAPTKPGPARPPGVTGENGELS